MLESLESISCLPTSGRSIPPLENGDYLTLDEFERRYDATPGLKKGELIDGIVYLPQSVSRFSQSSSGFNLAGVLGYYCESDPESLTRPT
jgi:hypothetical protein